MISTEIERGKVVPLLKFAYVFRYSFSSRNIEPFDTRQDTTATAYEPQFVVYGHGYKNKSAGKINDKLPIGECLGVFSRCFLVQAPFLYNRTCDT